MKGFLKKRPARIGSICILVIIVLAVIGALTDGFGLASKNKQDGGKSIASVTPTQKAGKEQQASVTPVATQRPAGMTVKINIISVDRELDDIVKKYAKEHWKFRYQINYASDEIVYSTQDLVDLTIDTLKTDCHKLDIYSLPVVYNDKFVRGEYSDYACPYSELGIDVAADLVKADIPSYAVVDGTNSNGQIVSLPYTSNPIEFVYRRSVAKKVWGTDDPDKISEIIGGGTNQWNRFMEAAKDLKQHGYYIVSGCRDLIYQFHSSDPYITSKFGGINKVIPKWQDYIDISKSLYDNGYISDVQQWSDPWYDIWKGKGIKTFGLFTIDDIYQYMDMGEIKGDWAVCKPPFNMIGDLSTGIIVNNKSPNKDLMGPLIEWITLDSSDSGLQHSLADGTYEKGDKISVMSGTVLKNTDSSRDVLGGQNINPMIDDILHSHPDKMQEYTFDKSINAVESLISETIAYLQGEKDKKTAISDLLYETK